uniref:Si:ch211-107m4.1 n=1 Tax=Oryzias latipes TaxID=8090 RepID=A0A3B3IB00_ORYLA
MKLADIKKLKVTELRSRLVELGLDSKGLKAELVDRLWSATTTSESQQDGAPAEEAKQRNLTTSSPSSDVEDLTSSPPAEADVTAPLKADRVREFTDCATQTEPDSDPPSALPTCGSEGETVCQAEGPQHAEDPGEHEDLGRGRAFYEFKEEIRYKRAKSPQAVQENDVTEQHIHDTLRFDPYNCHLHFEVGPDGCSGQPRFWDRFPLLWSGCRLTHGVQQGMVGFEVRVERKLLISQAEDGEVREPYGLRVGWSAADSSLLLGENELSFAYDGRGKKVQSGKEEMFGEPLTDGDIIGCYASFSADHVELSFHKNGRLMGVAFSFSVSRLRGRALFPHVLCRSCSVRLFSDPAAPEWYPGPPGFTSLTALPTRQRIRSSSAPPSKTQCEVVMMVGLPGSGKSFWAQTHMKEHPDKHYKLLGTQELLTCMISGGQKDNRLQQACQCLTELIKIAAQTPGNYILDQCNILFSALHYKLQLFAGFRRRVVVVFPPEDEWRRRLLEQQRNDKDHIPEIALLKLQVSCSLPETHSDLLEELQYVELPQDQAQTLLKKYKDEARRLLPPTIPKQPKKRPRLNKTRPHPYGPPPSHVIQWPGLPGWNNPLLNMQTWSQQLPRYGNTPHQDQSFSFNKDSKCS